MAGDEPVTSPDQHKPSNVKLARLGGTVTILILLAMIIGNHHTQVGVEQEFLQVEDLWLITVAGVIAALMLGDWLLRKNGLSSD